MNIYIDLALVAVAALAFGGGFLVSRLSPSKAQMTAARRAAKAYYLARYNQQMDELIVRNRQERAAFIHRYEGLVADLEREVEALHKAAVQQGIETVKAQFGNDSETEVI